jgi:hypothetical protein
MCTPDWNGWLASQWGPSSDCDGSALIIGLASNVVTGQNPSYTVQDFLSLFPKFGGPSITLAGVGTTANNPVVTVGSASGLAVGNLVAGANIPDGAVITAIAGLNVTLSQAPLTTGSISMTVWNASTLPVPVLLALVYLATSCLVQARWLEQWQWAMALFIAHYATLYAKSDGNPLSNIGQIAAQGIATGIQVSKSVGDVSVSYQPIQGIETWGAWNLTVYGQQLATLAKVVGTGPMLLY